MSLTMMRQRLSACASRTRSPEAHWLELCLRETPAARRAVPRGRRGRERFGGWDSGPEVDGRAAATARAEPSRSAARRAERSHGGGGAVRGTPDDPDVASLEPIVTSASSAPRQRAARPRLGPPRRCTWVRSIVRAPTVVGRAGTTPLRSKVDSRASEPRSAPTAMAAARLHPSTTARVRRSRAPGRPGAAYHKQTVLTDCFSGGTQPARMPEAARAPRTQQQRRDETRRALLDAAVESLIEVGFARTTTLEVQRRANVSRGALLHHFPSKAELLVAAVDHLA